jgi:hypothetical protein
MLEPAKISEIAGEVARAKLTPHVVREVRTEPVTDSEGDEALQVTIVIEPGAASKLNGDLVLDTLLQIQDRLQKAGEDRFAVVEYATQNELETGGGSQS